MIDTAPSDFVDHTTDVGPVGKELGELYVSLSPRVIALRV